MISAEGRAGVSLTPGHRSDPRRGPALDLRRLVPFSGLSWPPCAPECCPSLAHPSRFHTSTNAHMHMKYTHSTLAYFFIIRSFPRLLGFVRRRRALFHLKLCRVRSSAVSHGPNQQTPSANERGAQSKMRERPVTCGADELRRGRASTTFVGVRYGTGRLSASHSHS